MQGRYLRVKRWEDFIAYKDRTPTWIKLPNALLDDPEFETIPEPTRFYVPLIWLLASRNNGLIPNNAQWIQRKIGASKPPDLDALIERGILCVYGPSDECVHTSDPVKCLEESRREEKRVEEKREIHSSVPRGDFVEDDNGYAVNWDLVQAVYGHYLREFGKGESDYRLSKDREKVIRVALRTWGVENCKVAVGVFRRHPAFAFNRGEDPASNGKRFDGLAEYILCKGSLKNQEKRMEEILSYVSEKSNA